MAEYIAVNEQTVNPGESIIFTNTECGCSRGFIRHRDGTGSFLLAGYVPRRFMCPCMQSQSAEYFAIFGADLAIPEGGTVGEISAAIVVDGATVPASQMSLTPTALNAYGNVGKSIDVPVWRGCCETISIRNTSNQPILVRNANLVILRPDLYISQ